MDYRCRSRGIRRDCSGPDLIRRAYVDAGAVPAGGPDHLAGGTQVRRTCHLGCASLPVGLPAPVALSERIIVRGRVCADERIHLPVGVHVQVADALRVPEPVPAAVAFLFAVCVAVPFLFAVYVAVAFLFAVCVAVAFLFAVYVAVTFDIGVTIYVDEPVPVFIHGSEHVPIHVTLDGGRLRGAVGGSWLVLDGEA
jgi:hypothetical protein